MANLNKVMLIGRLTRDPESRTFANGGKVAKFGLAVAYIPQKKNPATGQWEGGETAFIDIEAFNSSREGGRQLADLVENYLRKGSQVFIEGRLRLNEWTDKEGQKRTKLLVVADGLQFLEQREGGGGASAPRMAPAPRKPAPPPDHFGEPEPDAFEPPAGGGDENPDNIPF
ncbi:MAG TPA: single-stranded DNA-binding protein [Gemmataceae bacterium]|nr:single-stranded DNA-binding protein [Gemmataceae bacterium]